MAAVYVAENLKHKRKVAFKFLKPELAIVLGPEHGDQGVAGLNPDVQMLIDNDVHRPGGRRLSFESTTSTRKIRISTRRRPPASAGASARSVLPARRGPLARWSQATGRSDCGSGTDGSPSAIEPSAVTIDRTGSG